MRKVKDLQKVVPAKSEFVHDAQSKVENHEEVEALKVVNRAVAKKDAAALVTGKVYIRMIWLRLTVWL